MEERILNTMYRRFFCLPPTSLCSRVILSSSLALALFATTAEAQTPPVSAPQTGLQAPLPSPSLPVPKAFKPLLQSPKLSGEMLAHPLTIQEAVAIALATNRNLALANANLLKAQGRTQEANTAFNPTAGSTLSYIRLNSGQTVQIGGANITFVNEEQKTIGVQMSLPIDISGMLRTAADQSRFVEIASRLDVNRASNQIVSDVKAAFYDVLRAQALTVVSTENLINSQTRLDDAQKRLKAGVVAVYDVIRAQTDVANAQHQVIQTRNSVSLAIANLNSVIGIDINTPLHVSNEGALDVPTGDSSTLNLNISPPPSEGKSNDELIQQASVAYDSLNLGADYDKVLKEAIETRPEVWQAEANLRASRKGILLARRSSLPSFALTWGMNYTPDTAGFAPQLVSWQAMAQVTLPLFDGGGAKARREQAKADIAASEVSKRTTVDSVTLEVRQAYLNLLLARNSVLVTKQVVTQAKEGYRLARVRYNEGVSAQAGISPLLEISDAQAALTLAESNQVNALYDYNSARARLDRAAGRYSYNAKGGGYTSPPISKSGAEKK